MIGFAAQTDGGTSGGLTLALQKLREKGLDAIYFNNVSGGAIFGEDETSGVLISENGDSESFTQVSKVTLANKILDLALNKLG